MGYPFLGELHTPLKAPGNMYLVFSTSLHPQSRSRILANAAATHIRDAGQECELIDLASMDPLPLCNGHDCYSDPAVGQLAGKIAAARGALIASPIYNYDVSASCKNMIELTGSAWNGNVVGLLCAAGGQGSYMAPTGLFNSLMLDFRCLILPKFVYAREDCFADGQITDPGIPVRIEELANQLIKLGACLAS